jgi:hypothetical protein
MRSLIRSGNTCLFAESWDSLVEVTETLNDRSIP